jgi:Zn-finger nucleic acid-binding protein
MICPVCEVAMVIVEFRDIELDYCTNCMGVWFDSGELELLLEAAEAEDYRAFLEGVVEKPEAATKEKKRKCPICIVKMKKVCIDDDKQVLIDICPHEHGIWFDHTEIEHLLKLLVGESPDNKGSSRVMGFLADVFKYSEQVDIAASTGNTKEEGI